jgi:hypothetical protein
MMLRCAARLMPGALCAIAVACASAPPPPPVIALPPVPVAVVVPPSIPWSDKIGWIVRLEDQRMIRDPDPPPPVVLRAATDTEPAVLARPAPADLIALLDDADAPVRQRAALAIGRTGLAEGVEPVARLLGDLDVDVRQMAAFALGLLRDPAARRQTPRINLVAPTEPHRKYIRPWRPTAIVALIMS